ncbi:MAG TPA: hypothetical protein PLC53_03280 [Bacilli bacterium]|nr:hypothetical protein [Bacilli bacterium]
MNKKQVYEEIKQIYVQEEVIEEVTDKVEVILTDMCNFWDTDTLIQYLNFIKDERDM